MFSPHHKHDGLSVEVNTRCLSLSSLRVRSEDRRFSFSPGRIDRPSFLNSQVRPLFPNARIARTPPSTLFCENLRTQVLSISFDGHPRRAALLWKGDVRVFPPPLPGSPWIAVNSSFFCEIAPTLPPFQNGDLSNISRRNSRT